MTPIQKKYQSLGIEVSSLGSPITAEISTPNGLGIYQEFQSGIIYYTADYGACVMKSGIVGKWKSDSIAKTLSADNKTTVRDYLGFPIRDTETTSRNSQVCYFERGMIVANGDFPENSFVVYGLIYATYRKFNDINGWMGFPKSDEQPSANGGRVSWFEQADIYWHPNVGAFEVHGAIKDKYNVLGASGSFLGYPISDENILMGDGREIGRSGNFEYGTVFWSGATGAFEMHGLLVQTYMRDFGGPAGELGFPTSDELSSPQGVYRFNNFQNGVLTCNMTNALIRKISNLHVVVTQLETDEDDDDLFVASTTSLTVFGSEVQRIDKNFGEYRNQGTKTLDEQEGFVGDFMLRDGNAALNIFMKSWDVDGGLNFGDDEIASFTKTFTIDSFWDSTFPDVSGNNLLTWYNGPDGSFRASLRIDIDGFDINSWDSANFRRDLFWNIHNPLIPELDFDTYAATFSDVEADDSPYFHPFNHIYYQAAYKKAAAPGTCFGMCVEAIYALKGRSASREPISQYTFDEQRKHDISVKFGYQLGASQINFMVSKFKSNEIWDPVGSFQKSRDMFQNGNYPILCMSEGVALAGGHAVLPYRWDDSNPNQWLMFVANPNSPFNEKPDNNFWDAVVKVDPLANTFSFQFSETKNWTGGGGLFNSGRMFPIPYSEVSTEPRTPFWEVLLTLITGGAYLVFAGDADVEQISDGGSLTYYDGQGNINTDPATRLKNVFPVETTGNPFGDFKVASKAFETGRFERAKTIIKSRKPNLFYLKNEKQKGQVYVERHQNTGNTFEAKINPALNTHLGTAIHSRAFAKNINASNFEQVLKTGSDDFGMLKTSGGVLNTLFNKSITFDITGKQDGEYLCGFASAKSKVMVSANASDGLTDQITIDSVNLPGQAFTFKANESAVNKKIKISLISFDRKRRYELENIPVQAGQTFTLQHNDACKELIIHNSLQTISFDLKLFSDGSDIPVLTKQNISLDPSSVNHIEPNNWVDIENRTAGSPLKIDVYNNLGGVVLNSKLL